MFEYNKYLYKSGIQDDGEIGENPQLSNLELVCIIWFTFEYLLRFIGAPKKWGFIKDGMNIIDVLAILPYFISMFLIEVKDTKLLNQL